jgi:hypothetical protein
MTDENRSGAVTEYTQWLQNSVSSYEALAKTLVKHKAEKGRIVEGVVKTALRAILPGRFSIGSGFAINSIGEASSQLDLVIYDAVYNAPIVLEGGTGLFPIECIYGLVEVKSRLDRAEIDSITKAIGAIRKMALDKRYARYGSQKNSKGKSVAVEIEVPNKLPPRAFVVAINADYNAIESMETALRELTKSNGAHIHGMAILEKDWFVSQRVYKDPREFDWRQSHALAAFCAAVLASIQSMSMGPASMRRYLGLQT